MINQTELVHNVLSLSNNFNIMTTNNEPLEPEYKHDVLLFQWFVCDDIHCNLLPSAELTASMMGNAWIGVRVV